MSKRRRYALLTVRSFHEYGRKLQWLRAFTQNYRFTVEPQKLHLKKMLPSEEIDLFCNASINFKRASAKSDQLLWSSPSKLVHRRTEEIEFELKLFHCVRWCRNNLYHWFDDLFSVFWCFDGLFVSDGSFDDTWNADYFTAAQNKRRQSVLLHLRLILIFRRNC